MVGLCIDGHKYELLSNVKIPILFTFFLFSSVSITPKLDGVCKYCTNQTTALLSDIFLFWFGVVYKIQLLSYGHKTLSKRCFRCSVVKFWGFTSHIPGPGYNLNLYKCQVTFMRINCIAQCCHKLGHGVVCKIFLLT